MTTEAGDELILVEQQGGSYLFCCLPLCCTASTHDQVTKGCGRDMWPGRINVRSSRSLLWIPTTSDCTNLTGRHSR